MIDNDIDGETLLLLVGDLSEFSQMITKPVARLRMKSFVCKMKNSCEIHVSLKKVDWERAVSTLLINFVGK